MKCGFSDIVPNREDVDIQVTVRDGTLDDNQLGFSRENGAGMVQGEGLAEACRSNPQAGSVSRVRLVLASIKKGFTLASAIRRGPCDMTVSIGSPRWLVSPGDRVVPQVGKHFEFLAEP